MSRMNRRTLFGILAAAPLAAIGIKARPVQEGDYHGWTYWGEQPMVDYPGEVLGWWQRWDANRQQMLVSPTIGPVQWCAETGPMTITPRAPWQSPHSSFITESAKETARQRLESFWACSSGKTPRRVQLTGDWGQSVLNALFKA